MKKLITFLFLLIGITVLAQDNPFYDQYLQNRMFINPAYAGSLEQTEIRANFRRQWQDFEGAPSVNSLSFQTRLFDGKRSAIYKKVGHGLGATLFTETEGPMRMFGLTGTYAYHIPFDKFQLAAGLNLSASNYGLDYTKLSYALSDDPAAIQEDNKRFIPDADLGVYMYSTEGKYFLGLTAAQMIRGSINLNSSDSASAVHNGMGRQFILMGSIRAIDNLRFIFETGFVGILRQEYMPQNEIHINATLSVVNYLNRYNDEVLSFMLSYRTSRAFVAQVQLGMANLYLAYAYEHSFSKIQTYAGATHNVSIGINIDKYRR